MVPALRLEQLHKLKMAKAVSVDPTSRSQLSHHASALYRVQRRAGLGPRFMVLRFDMS